MMQVIDEDYFRAIVAEPGWAEKLVRMFSEIADERDKARHLADAAAQGFATVSDKCRRQAEELQANSLQDLGERIGCPVGRNIVEYIEERSEKVSALQDEIASLVRAVAARKLGHHPVETLYDYVAANWPTDWQHAGGNAE